MVNRSYKWSRTHKTIIGIIFGLIIIICLCAGIGALLPPTNQTNKTDITITSYPPKPSEIPEQSESPKLSETSEQGEPFVISTTILTNTPSTEEDTSTIDVPDIGVYYRNCAEAKAAGAAPLHYGDPGYRKGLDRDGDGTACEN